MPESDGVSGASASQGARGASVRSRGRATPRPKRIPERTCIACRQVAGKRTLVRIVRTVSGGVEVDLTGRKNGRGAYLHADVACWDLALRRGALNSALKTTVGEADLATIRAYRNEIAGTSAPGEATMHRENGDDQAENRPQASVE